MIGNGSLSITLPNAARPNYLRPRTAAMSLSLVFQVVSFNGPAIPAPRPQMQVSDQGLVRRHPARRGEPAS